ncbi:MAG: DUF4845 domain-containing protein [Azoarcus sp.]|jgi:hypothetical protein|nr:DUF4845 domain-containing protein [Azoarcus sp.]
MMKFRQRGMSLIGMMFVAILLGFALLLGFKVFSPYKEYLSLKRIIVQVASEADSDALESDLRQRYERRAIVDGIDETVKPGDLVIRRTGGGVVIEAEYSRKVPLVSNVSLLFDFKASSRDGGK